MMTVHPRTAQLREWCQAQTSFQCSVEKQKISVQFDTNTTETAKEVIIILQKLSSSCYKIPPLVSHMPRVHIGNKCAPRSSTYEHRSRTSDLTYAAITVTKITHIQL